jgi:ribosomal protein S18 acetylase RimI-like enzyme
MIEGVVLEVFSDKKKICQGVLDDLPDWFGIPESVDAYVRTVEDLSMFGFALDDQIVGFISLKEHNKFVAEAYVLGVKRDWHRRGIGRRLFEHAAVKLQAQGFSYLTVKTVASDRPNKEYAGTRRFYEALGFLPVEVFPTLWGPENSCLLMIKPLG